MIDKVEFGRIKIRGKTHEEDVIIFWDGEILERKRSHKVSEKEMEEILLKEPEVVVVGSGFGGALKVEDSAEKLCEGESVEVKILKTPEAVKEFNALLKEGKKVAGIFHLTC